MLLPEVLFFIIKDLFGISSKENTIQLDGGIPYDRRTVSTFRGEGWYCNYSNLTLLLINAGGQKWPKACN